MSSSNSYFLRKSKSVNAHLNSNLTSGMSQSGFINLLYKIQASRTIANIKYDPFLWKNPIILLRAAYYGLCEIQGVSPAVLKVAKFRLEPDKQDKDFFRRLLEASLVRMDQRCVPRSSKAFPPKIELTDDATLTLKMLEETFDVNSVMKNVSDQLKDNKQFILDMIKLVKTWEPYNKRNLLIPRYISSRLLNDREVVFALLELDSKFLQNVSLECQKDYKVNFKAFMLSSDGLDINDYKSRNLGYRCEQFLFHPTIIEKKSPINWKDYPSHTGEYQASRMLEFHTRPHKFIRSGPVDHFEGVLLAVKCDGMLLMYASKRLRNNKDIVEAAVRQNSQALKFASIELRNSKSIILAALSPDHDRYCFFGAHTLEFARELIANDLELALQLVSRDGCLLQHVSLELKKNSELVFAAVKQDGHALQYADEILKRNRALVRALAKLNFFCLEYACDDLKADRALVMEAVQCYGRNLRHASEKLRNDREVVSEAVKQFGGSLLYASEELRNNREVVSEAVKQCGWALAFASEELQNDCEVVMLSTSRMYGSLYYFASPNLRDGGLVDYVYWLRSNYPITLDDFLSSFLFGLVSVNSMSSKLTLLNFLGEEALLDFQLQIVEYVGVQVGKRWHIINNASKRLMLNLEEVKYAGDFLDEQKDLKSMFRFLDNQDPVLLSKEQKQLVGNLLQELRHQGLNWRHFYDW